MEGKDVRPEVEKRIGSVRADIFNARRAQSLEEPVGERLAVTTKRNGLSAHWTSGHAIGSRSTLVAGTAARVKRSYASRELPDRPCCAQKRAPIIRVVFPELRAMTGE